MPKWGSTVAIPFEQLEGKYEILEKMSEGGMGAVYKVRHRLLEEVRVVKVMRPQLADDPMLKARFLREAKIAVKLRHPNLAQIYDYAMDEKGYSYIVMEFIDGVNLQELLKASGPPGLGLLLEIAHQALEVIEYIHRRDVIHRDISPDNLLLARDEDGDPVVKMIDLGIAKTQATESGLTTEGAFLGKVRYSSPEHFRSREGMQVGPHSDIYSFGVVLYELATGTYPIRGNSLSSFIAGHLLHPPLEFSQSDPEGRVPQALRTAILSALAKDPVERFPSAAAFAKALAGLRASNPCTPDDLRAAFEVEALETRRLKVIKPGSTQSRLDRNFGLSETPPPSPPGASLQPPPPASPAPGPGSAASATASQVHALLVGAEKLLEAHHYGEALVQARAAVELDPDSTEARRILEAVEVADTKRRERRESAARRIDDLVESGDLEAAAQELAVAAERLGECAELADAAQRLDGARAEKQRRHDEAARELAHANVLLKKGKPVEAARALERVLDLEPESADAGRLLESARAEADRLEEARRLEQRIAQASAEITRLLGAGSLDEAEAALTSAEREFPGAPALAGLRTRLDQQRLRQRSEEADGLCRSAERSLEAGDPPTAIAQLELALRLAPGHAAATDLLDRARREAARLDRVRAAVEGVERLLAAGRHDSALRALEKAEADLGPFAQADDLRRRVTTDAERLAARRASVRALADRARSLAEEGHVDRAMAEIRAAQKEVADDPELHELVEEAARDVPRLAEAARRRRALQEALSSIQARLEASDAAAAGRELEVARRLFGDDPALDALSERLDDLERDERRRQAEELLRAALSSETSFPKMLSRLEEALDLDPGNATIQRVLAETRGAHHRYQQERRSRSIADAMTRIDGLIAAGKLEAAVETLDRAVAELGEFPEARSVRQRLRSGGGGTDAP